MLSNFPRNPALSPCESVSHFVVSPTRLGRIAMLDLGPKLDPTGTREPLSWHSFFGHSFRFHKRVLASPSRRRGLGKGTAFEYCGADGPAAPVAGPRATGNSPGAITPRTATNATTSLNVQSKAIPQQRCICWL